MEKGENGCWKRRNLTCDGCLLFLPRPGLWIVKVLNIQTHQEVALKVLVKIPQFCPSDLYLQDRYDCKSLQIMNIASAYITDSELCTISIGDTLFPIVWDWPRFPIGLQVVTSRSKYK